MKLQPLIQFIKLCLQLPQNTMNNYTMWWQPQNQSAFASDCPFVNVELGTFTPSNVDWPNGYYTLEQNLNQNQFSQVDTAANNHVCIDIKPSPAPPGNPHGR